MSHDHVIFSKSGQRYLFRPLLREDGPALASYFEAFSGATRSRFGPHPLDREYAEHLCQEQPAADSARATGPWTPGRGPFVIANPNGDICGYIIVEACPAPEEIARFAAAQVDISSGTHWRLAPSVADAMQNSGLASAALRVILTLAKQCGVDSIVLMGGTQSTNTLGLAFYRKFRFTYVTSYWTELENYDMYLRSEDFPGL